MRQAGRAAAGAGRRRYQARANLLAATGARSTTARPAGQASRGRAGGA